MDQHKDYVDRAARVRSLVAESLGSDSADAERLGKGLFVFGGAEYGKQGEKGDVVWYVSRVDDPTAKRRRLSFEWRAHSPEAIAAALIRAYEELAPQTEGD